MFYEPMANFKNQFTVKTYLCYPTEIINDLDHAEEHKDGHFIFIDDAKRMFEIKPNMKKAYIDGAMEILYGDIPLVTVRDWSEMDLLIPSFYSMAYEFVKDKYGEGCIPGCSIIFYMSWIGEDILLFERYDAGVLQYSLTLPIYAFLKALLDHFEHFYVRLGEYFDGLVPYEGPLAFVRRLKHIVDNTPQNEWWPLIIRGYVHDPLKPMLSCVSSDPYSLRAVQTVEGNGKIVRISNRLKPEACVGFFYIEHAGVSMFKKYYLYRMVPFCRQLLSAVENVLVNSAHGVVGVDGVFLQLEEVGRNELKVTARCVGEDVFFVLQKKSFLKRLLWISYKFLCRIDSGMRETTGVRVLTADIDTINRLDSLVAMLPD